MAKDVDIAVLANVTAGFSGADITEICQRAAKNAIRDAVAADIARAKKLLSGEESVSEEYTDPVPVIRTDHFEEAVARSRRSVSDSDLQYYEQFNSMLKTDADLSQRTSFRFNSTTVVGQDTAVDSNTV